MALCAVSPGTLFDHVEALQLESTTPIPPHERRRLPRRAFVYHFDLRPLDDDVIGAEPVLVVGRDLGRRGVGFEHPVPLPYRKVLLRACDPRLASLELSQLELEVALRWCRFVGPGRYQSGGRIVRSSGVQSGG